MHAPEPIALAPRELFFYLTFACSLACRHCYVGHELAPGTHAPLDMVLSAVEEASRDGVERITLLGGEPTLHPSFPFILARALELPFRRVVVDTGGAGRDPVPADLSAEATRRLTVRVGLDGPDSACHDALRGRGSFHRAVRTLRAIRARGVRAEVTFTVHAANHDRLEETAGWLATEGVAELNLHWLSRAGHGRMADDLQLSAKQVLDLQARVEAMEAPLPLRWPRLLVPREELPRLRARGLACRIGGTSTRLQLPDGRRCECPLQIDLGVDAFVPGYGDSGCPLVTWLLPNGLPPGLAMTCISWKR